MFSFGEIVGSLPLAKGPDLAASAHQATELNGGKDLAGCFIAARMARPHAVRRVLTRAVCETI